MKRLIYLCSFALLAASCSNNHSQYHLIKQNDIKIAGIKVFRVIPMNWYDSSDGMRLWLKISDSCIGQYSFQSRAIIDSIGIHGRHLNGQIDFNVTNNGGIYIFDKDRQTCKLVDRSGDVVHRYKYNDRETELYLLNFPLIETNRCTYFFYCPAKLVLPRDNADYYSRKNLIEARLSDSTIDTVGMHCLFPQQYRQAMYDETVPCTTVTPYGLAYAYSIEPAIYLDEKGTTSKHVVRGLKANKYVPVSPDSVIHGEYNNRIKLSMDEYIQLLYDDRTKVYLLFQAMQTANANNDMEELSAYRDRPFTIYIIDSTFHLIGSKKFDLIGDYRLTNAHFSKGILYLPKANLETNQLKIETYALTKNN